MQTIQFEVTSSRSLLMHNGAAMVPDEVQDENGKKEAGKGGAPKLRSKIVPTPEVEAEAGAYRLPDGRLYLPAEAFRSAMLEAATGRKIGKRGAGSVVSGSLFVTSDVALLTDPDSGESLTEYVIDRRRVVLGGKVAVVRARPRLDRWATVVEFEYDEDFVNRESIVELMEIAGRIIGVGDFRGGRHRGSFGRFEARVVVAETAAPPHKKRRAA